VKSSNGRLHLSRRARLSWRAVDVEKCAVRDNHPILVDQFWKHPQSCTRGDTWSPSPWRAPFGVQILDQCSPSSSCLDTNHLQLASSPFPFSPAAAPLPRCLAAPLPCCPQPRQSVGHMHSRVGRRRRDLVLYSSPSIIIIITPCSPSLQRSRRDTDTQTQTHRHEDTQIHRYTDT